jgi:tripeptidyl-peptidase I
MLLRLLSAAIAGGAALHASAGIVPATTKDNGVSALQERSSWAKRAIPETHRVHERAMPHWMSDWTKGERIAGDAVLPVRIGLKQSNLKEGHDRLMDM